MEYLWDNYRDVYDWEEKDFDGKTALMLSIDYKNDNITEFLIGALNITDILISSEFAKETDWWRTCTLEKMEIWYL